MSEPSSSVRPDWWEIRPTMYNLYVEKNMTLKGVMDKIKEKYPGFEASEKQYKMQFICWGWRKNASEDDYKLLDRIVQSPNPKLLSYIFNMIGVPLTEEQIAKRLRSQGNKEAAGLQRGFDSAPDTNHRQGPIQQLYQPHHDLPDDAVGHNITVAEETGRAAPHAQSTIADPNFNLGSSESGADDDSLSAMSVDNETGDTNLHSMPLSDPSLGREYMAPTPAAGYDELGGRFFNQGPSDPLDPLGNLMLPSQGLGNLFSNQAPGNLNNSMFTPQCFCPQPYQCPYGWASSRHYGS